MTQKGVVHERRQPEANHLANRAGSPNGRGYLRLRFKSKQYLAHRIAWLFMTGHDPGSQVVDHIDQQTEQPAKLNVPLAKIRCVQPGPFGLETAQSTNHRFQLEV